MAVSPLNTLLTRAVPVGGNTILLAVGCVAGGGGGVGVVVVAGGVVVVVAAVVAIMQEMSYDRGSAMCKR